MKRVREAFALFFIKLLELKKKKAQNQKTSDLAKKIRNRL
jgi:hypothetical protein